MLKNKTPHTCQPITISGWYEHTDGTIGEYNWHNGRASLGRVVASWADVPSAADEEARYAREEAEQIAARAKREAVIL